MKSSSAKFSAKISKNTSDKSWRQILITTVAAVLFFIFICLLYMFTTKDGQTNRIFVHNSYDSYTRQAMAWRRGEVKLDKNYPYLELAIYNEAYFSTHEKDDYAAYREQFGNVNDPIID